MKPHFIIALDALKAMLLSSAALAEESVRKAVTAASEYDTALAQEIIDGDRELDHGEVVIEEECLKILALHQPVAGDLRMVVTILKVNAEVERVGDLAVNIADRVADLGEWRNGDQPRIDFTEMVEDACRMLREALHALMSGGEQEAAQKVIRDDEEVDAIHRENYAVARTALAVAPLQAQYYLDCLTISRCLERVADIATNIAEDVLYLETGRIVRHSS